MTTVLASVFCAFALTASTLPNPSDTFFSWFSPETADAALKCVAMGEYHPHLDYNGDGVLSVADAVCISRRYQENCEFGNEITIDGETVDAIVSENYADACIYWEFDFVDGVPCRQYEITADHIMTANIYLEFEGYSDNVTIEINPFQEIAKVIS